MLVAWRVLVLTFILSVTTKTAVSDGIDLDKVIKRMENNQQLYDETVDYVEVKMTSDPKNVHVYIDERGDDGVYRIGKTPHTEMVHPDAIERGVHFVFRKEGFKSVTRKIQMPKSETDVKKIHLKMKPHK